MAENGKRFDTVEFDAAKHPQRHERKYTRTFGEHFVPRWVYRIALILLLCVLGTLGWMNRDNLTPNNILEWIQSRAVGMGIGDGYPYSIAGTSVSPKNFLSADKNIFLASDTSLTVLNSTAKEIVSRQHSFNNPVLKLSGNRMLLYNLGGRECRLETLSRSLNTITLEQNLVAGALAQQGNYALLTEADGYCGELTAYMPDGREQFHYWFSDYYPTSVALSPDGGTAVVTGINTDNGVLQSAIYLLDLNSEEVQQPFAVSDENMLFDVSWNGDSTITAVGDHSVIIIDASSRKKYEYNYNGLKLTAYDSSANMVVLGLSPYTGSDASVLVLLNRMGEKILSPSLQGTIWSVSAFGSAAAALCDSNIYFYTSSPAASAGTVAAGGDAKAIALRDETSAYVLGVSEIRMVSVR
ncbi:MAG: DUF5050 domain-containing protein [Oscillospiraceae bacterium]|jgi:hypothetical protein